MAYILHQAPAIHGHGVGGYEQLESAGGCLPGHAPLPGSTSVRAAFVHVVGDLLQSIGVLVAATIIYFKVRGPCVGWAPVLHRALGGTGGHWGALGPHLLVLPARSLMQPLLFAAPVQDRRPHQYPLLLGLRPWLHPHYPQRRLQSAHGR